MNNNTKILLGILGFLLIQWDKLFGSTTGGDLSNNLGDLSFLGNDTLPRGMRNNNPGNLKVSSSAWQGKIPVSQNTDGTFEQFYSYLYGIRAMIKLIKNTYIGSWGKRTIREIIQTYAPNTENDSEAYIFYVSELVGISPDQILSTDRESMRRLIQAMAYYENGRTAITNDQFNAAWEII